MVALLPREVEREVLFSPVDPFSTHLYRCSSAHLYRCSRINWVQGVPGEGALVWPGEVRRSIAAPELIPVVISAMLWGSNWRGSIFHSDNEAVVKVLSKGSSKDSSLSHLIRCLALLAAFYGFHISAVHVPGSLNKAADALSQNNLCLFHSLYRETLQESPIPPHVVQLLVTQTPKWGSTTWTKLFSACLDKGLPPPWCHLI